MKVLIWFLCILVYSLFVNFLKLGGVNLGGIPTVIFVGLTLLIARALCKEWDEHVKEKRPKKTTRAAKITKKVFKELRLFAITPAPAGKTPSKPHTAYAREGRRR